MDLTTLRDILQDGMTRKDCYLLAVIAGLNAQSVQEIRDSSNSVNLLIDKLRDSGRIHGDDMDVLLFALDTIHLRQIARQIDISDNRRIPGSVWEIETEVDYSRSICICRESSFEELTSYENEPRTVILRCSSCSAEWFNKSIIFENTSASETGSSNLSLSGENDRFSYKRPCELDLSKLCHEDVTHVSQLRRGDHIMFRRCCGIYYHHAILVEVDGHKLKVVEWSSRCMDCSINVYLKDVNFPRGGLKRQIYENGDDTDLVIARAYSMVNNSTQQYNLIANNCETLATYCKVGKGISIQGQKLKDFPPRVRNAVRDVVRDVVRRFRGLLKIKYVPFLFVFAIAYYTRNYW